MDGNLSQRFFDGSRATTLRTFAIVSLAALMLAGCDDKRRHQASEEVAFKIIEPAAGADASPEAIAKEALAAMQELQRVRAEGMGKDDNRAKYEEAMGRLFGVADRDRIYALVKPDPAGGGGSPFAPTDITENAAVRRVAESWTSETAYYINGLDLDSVVAKKASGSDDRMLVSVNVVNANDRSALAEIRSQSGMGPADAPFASLTAEQQQKIRDAALKRGFNVPIEAQIRLVVAKTKSGWRVQKVDVGPGR
ncbi:MAG: hypothetical protein H6818_20145 [Phycisphaerales bacterium]|nr:hypothetical protein [Phycisphaerales bacterium]